MFTININKRAPNVTYVEEVAVTTFGDGTDASLVMWDGSDDNPILKRTSFYINKDNQRLIAINPFLPQLYANAYTEQPEGGEIKFTFEKDDKKKYYWPKFGLGELYELTVDGKPDAFYLCGTTNSTATLVKTGALAIGKVDGKYCQHLDDTLIFPLDSKLF